MTPLQKKTMAKIGKLIEDDKNWLVQECETLLTSGGIDAAKYPDDDYRLAQIVLSAALNELAVQRKPRSPDDLRAARNLEFF